jgi:hypothetical protein
MGGCAFCGDETLGDVRPMAHIDQSRAHRNVQRAHPPRETILLPSSHHEYLLTLPTEDY